MAIDLTLRTGTIPSDFGDIPVNLLEWNPMLTEEENFARFYGGVLSNTKELIQGCKTMNDFILDAPQFESSWYRYYSSGVRWHICDDENLFFDWYTDGLRYPPSLAPDVFDNTLYTYRFRMNWGSAFVAKSFTYDETKLSIEFSALADEKHFPNKYQYARGFGLTYPYPYVGLFGFYSPSGSGSTREIIKLGYGGNCFGSDSAYPNTFNYWVISDSGTMTLINENYEDDPEPTPPEPPTPTPTEDDMDINSPNIGQVFNRQYIFDTYDFNDFVDELALKTGSAVDHDANLWEQILNAMRLISNKVETMFGGFAGWLDNIVDITVYPVDINRVIPHEYQLPVTAIRVGLIEHIWTEGENASDEIDADAFRITRNDILFDLTNWYLIQRRYNDFRDFPPYRTAKLYIPFIGIVDFDASNYYGKYLKIVYAIDINTGGCRAFVCVNSSNTEPSKNASGGYSEIGTIVATYDGQMGIHLPISGVDYNNYISGMASALGSTISSGMSAGVSASSSASNGSFTNNGSSEHFGQSLGTSNDLSESFSQSTSKTVGNSSSTSGSTSSSMGFNPVGVATGTMDFARKCGNPPAMTKGSASPTLNAYGSYKAYITWYEVKTNETGNLLQLEGYPSNKSGQLKDFSGFLSVASCELECPNATAKEKQVLQQMLTQGVHI